MIFLDFGFLWVFIYLLVARLQVTSPRGEKIALAFACALGLKSLVIYVLVLLGLTKNIWVQSGVSLGALVIAGIFCSRQSTNSLSQAHPREKKSLLFLMTVLILGVLFCISLAYALYFPITEADGIWYHIRGMVFLHAGGFDSETIVSQFRQYPPFVPLLYAYLLSFEVDTVKIIFPLLYLCLLVIFYCRILAVAENQKIAVWFTLILGTTPYFWWHSFLPFLDLATGFYYSIGALYWFSLIQNILSTKPENEAGNPCAWAILSGTLFGLSAWSRLEFLLYNAIPILILIYALDRNDTFNKSRKNKILLCLAAPSLFFSTLWFLTLAGFDSPIDRKSVV